jgi:hypothetical protein
MAEPELQEISLAQVLTLPHPSLAMTVRLITDFPSVCPAVDTQLQWRVNEVIMTLRCIRYMFVVAGTMLAGGPVIHAQDANRDVVATVSDVGTIVDRVEKKAGEFKGAFDNAVSHSTLDGTPLEATAKRRADDVHEAAKKLGDVFHDKKDKNHPAVRDQADKTIAAASELNRVMLDHRFTDKLQRDWDLLRSDLNALAKVYDLSPLGGQTQGR